MIRSTYAYPRRDAILTILVIFSVVTLFRMLLAGEWHIGPIQHTIPDISWTDLVPLLTLVVGYLQKRAWDMRVSNGVKNDNSDKNA